ncbi:MAG: GNAT family N-acetyltransferase [Candidatus Thermoplasmatota archaeon]
MRIATYDEIDPLEVLHLNVAAFGWFLDEDTVRKLRRIDPACSDWFALYGIEDGRVVSQIGATYPSIETIEGSARIGYVWGVATLPSSTRRGYQKRLLKELHERMRTEGAEIYFLATSKGLVAHALYQQCGYRDLQYFRWGMRSSRGRRGDIHIIKRKIGGSALFELYRRASKGGTGFVHREPNFPRIVKAWMPHTYAEACIFLREGEKIGYALVQSPPPSPWVREIVCPEPSNIPSCLDALDARYRAGALCCGLHTRATTVGQLRSAGIALDRESHGVIMVRGAEPMSPRRIETLLGWNRGSFQMTALDVY